jgi:Flp pilus assembly protein TadG
MLNRSDAKQNASMSANILRFRSRAGRGQSMVEFAFIATIAMVVMLVGIQFALIGQAALAISQGSAALARYAAVNPGALGTYNGTATLNTAATNLLSPTIVSGLTVTVNSYQGTTGTQTSAPIAAQDRVVISMSYDASSKIFLPKNGLLGISFPTQLSASESQLYE